MWCPGARFEQKSEMADYSSVINYSSVWTRAWLFDAINQFVCDYSIARPLLSGHESALSATAATFKIQGGGRRGERLWPRHIKSEKLLQTDILIWKGFAMENAYRRTHAITQTTETHTCRRRYTDKQTHTQVHIHTHMHTQRNTQKHKDRQIHTYRQTHTDRYTCIHSYTHTLRHTDRKLHRQADTQGQTDTHKEKDRQTGTHKDNQTQTDRNTHTDGQGFHDSIGPDSEGRKRDIDRKTIHLLTPCR